MQLGQRVPEVNKVLQAQLVLQDLRDLLGFKDRKVLLVRLDLQDLLEQRVRKVHRVWQDLQEDLAHQYITGVLLDRTEGKSSMSMVPAVTA